MQLAIPSYISPCHDIFLLSSEISPILFIYTPPALHTNAIQVWKKYSSNATQIQILVLSIQIQYLEIQLKYCNRNPNTKLAPRALSCSPYDCPALLQLPTNGALWCFLPENYSFGCFLPKNYSFGCFLPKN